MPTSAAQSGPGFQDAAARQTVSSMGSGSVMVAGQMAVTPFFA